MMSKYDGELLSVVVPVYLGAEMVFELVNRIEVSLTKFHDNFELILVNDSSPDNSWGLIKQTTKEKSWVKGIDLSRNFGQHYAISAGLEHSKGDWVVVMDCDLQDQPEEIQKLYECAVRGGYDSVKAQRVERQDGFFKRLGSKAFYNVLGYLSGMNLDSSVANFGIYRKKVIVEINKLTEQNRYFPTMVNWVGFNSTVLPVAHAERKAGESSYNFLSLFKLATDIILANSDKPLMLMMRSGILISIVAVIIGSLYFYKWLTGGIIVPGYTSLILSIWFLFGLTMIMLGVLAMYLGKMFQNIKSRPYYIVNHKINLEE